MGAHILFAVLRTVQLGFTFVKLVVRTFGELCHTVGIHGEGVCDIPARIDRRLGREGDGKAAFVGDIELDGIYECIIGDKSAEEVILQSPDVKKLWLLPSSIKLVAADTELPMMENAHFVIKNIINQVRDKYDYIFVDCSPSLGYTTVNILTAADSVLIPVQCEYLALEGLSKLLNTIKLVKSGLNPELDIEGFVLTMYMRNRLNNQVATEVREHFGELAFDTVIQRNIRLGEAPSHGKPIMLYDAAASGSVNYLNLAKEFLKRNRKQSK